LGVEVEECLPDFATAEELGRVRHGRLKGAREKTRDKKNWLGEFLFLSAT
jgi:hypothetical protein